MTKILFSIKERPILKRNTPGKIKEKINFKSKVNLIELFFICKKFYQK